MQHASGYKDGVKNAMWKGIITGFGWCGRFGLLGLIGVLGFLGLGTMPAQAGTFCDIDMSQAIYVNGDTVTATTVRLANPGTAPVPIELKIWLGRPGGPPISVVNAGADGSVILLAGLDLNLGPVTLFPVTPGIQQGAYEFSCRMLDPVTHAILAEDLTPFGIQ